MEENKKLSNEIENPTNEPSFAEQPNSIPMSTNDVSPSDEPIKQKKRIPINISISGILFLCCQLAALILFVCGLSYYEGTKVSIVSIIQMFASLFSLTWETIVSCLLKVGISIIFVVFLIFIIKYLVRSISLFSRMYSCASEEKKEPNTSFYGERFKEQDETVASCSKVANNALKTCFLSILMGFIVIVANNEIFTTELAIIFCLIFVIIITLISLLFINVFKKENKKIDWQNFIFVLLKNLLITGAILFFVSNVQNFYVNKIGMGVSALLSGLFFNKGFLPLIANVYNFIISDILIIVFSCKFLKLSYEFLNGAHLSPKIHEASFSKKDWQKLLIYISIITTVCLVLDFLTTLDTVNMQLTLELIVNKILALPKTYLVGLLSTISCYFLCLFVKFEKPVAPQTKQ